MRSKARFNLEMLQKYVSRQSFTKKALLARPLTYTFIDQFELGISPHTPTFGKEQIADRRAGTSSRLAILRDSHQNPSTSELAFVFQNVSTG